MLNLALFFPATLLLFSVSLEDYFEAKVKVPCLQESPSTGSLPRNLGHRRFSALPPSLAVSGRLEVCFYFSFSSMIQLQVRLIGCQNLITEIAERLPRQVAYGAPGSNYLASENTGTKSKGRQGSTRSSRSVPDTFSPLFKYADGAGIYQK